MENRGTMSPLEIRPAWHAFAPDPVTSTYIWHVLNISKLETFIAGGLWCARIDQFGDPREGLLPERNRLGLYNALPASGARWVEQQFTAALSWSFASCWFMSRERPPAEMVRTFGTPGETLVLRSTPAKMLAALLPFSSTPGAGPCYFGRIRYVDHKSDSIPDWNVIEAAYVVRADYSGENEARVLVHINGTAGVALAAVTGPRGPLVIVAPATRQAIAGQHDGRAIVLPIDPSSFIEEVWAADVNHDNLERVRAALARTGGLHNKLVM
jgi:hypothetical protein